MIHKMGNIGFDLVWSNDFGKIVQLLDAGGGGRACQLSILLVMVLLKLKETYKVYFYLIAKIQCSCMQTVCAVYMHTGERLS